MTSWDKLSFVVKLRGSFWFFIQYRVIEIKWDHRYSSILETRRFNKSGGFLVCFVLFFTNILPNFKSKGAGSKVSTGSLGRAVFKARTCPLWYLSLTEFLTSSVAIRCIMAAIQFIQSINWRFGQIWLCILASLFLSGPSSLFWAQPSVDSCPWEQLF